MHGGGGLADALHKLLDAQCSDQHGVADDDDAWLREQLQSLLKQKPNAGTFCSKPKRGSNVLFPVAGSRGAKLALTTKLPKDKRAGGKPQSKTPARAKQWMTDGIW